MSDAPDSRTPKTPPAAQAGAPGSERFRVSGADLLAADTWGDAPETCPNCGIEVAEGDSRCASCGQWLARCSGSCPSCASPKCVGGKRKG